MKHTLLALVLLIASLSTASAHALLKSTNPSDGSTISSGQSAVELTFGKTARVTKVVLIEPDGTEQRLEISVRDFTKFLVLDADLTAVGSYQVQWRALSEDGHPLKGSFSFNVE